MILLLIGVLFANFNCAETESDLTKFSDELKVLVEITAGMDKFLKCPRKAWHSYPVSKHTLALQFSPQNRTYEIKTYDPKFATQNATFTVQQLLPSAGPGYVLANGNFERIEKDGLKRVTVGINVKETKDLWKKITEFYKAHSQNRVVSETLISKNAFSIGLHENFHLHQPDQFKHVNSVVRETPVPFPTDFALGRSMAILHLYRGLRQPTKKPQEVCHAVGWLKQAQERDPFLFNSFRSIDILEGSAKYFESVASAIAFGSGGCNFEVDDFLNALNYGEIDRSDQDPHTQSYLLGALSGLVLDQLNIPDWQKRVEAGESPADILMKESKCGPELDLKPDSKILSDLKTKAEQDLEYWNSVKLQLDSNDYTRVSVDVGDRLGSFMTVGFLVNRERGVKIIRSMTSNFQSPTLNLKSNSKDAFETDDNPCGSGKSFFLVPNKDLREKGEQISVSSIDIQAKSSVEGVISEYKKIFTADKKLWICVQSKNSN